MKSEELSTRDRMVRATCELLEAQGYHATGLSEILQRSETPRGSLYYYFPAGKEELAVEAVEAQGRFIEARMREDMAVTASAADAVRQMFYKLMHLATSTGCRGALGPITAVALESSTTSERLRQVCAEVYERWRLVFEEKFMACGISQEDATSLSYMVLGALEGASTLTRTLRSGDPMQQTGEQLARLISVYEPKP